MKEVMVNPLGVFVFGMMCAVTLAVWSVWALWYYRRAKNIVPTLEEIKRKKSESDDLSKQIGESRHKLDSLKDLYAKAMKTIDDRREVESRIAELEKQLVGLIDEVGGKSRELKGLNDEIQKARSSKNVNPWSNLEAPIVVEPDGNDMRKFCTKVNEQEWLDNFSKKLSEHGFVFDQRSIYAFHTGLKCARHTPLVVLAGISGTGKSLLPELYASAAGINFLPVAVQPRWDSPQDLFGFYNHLEGRYKATELSRLLWQYDYCNNGEAEKIPKQKMPLNLVLLDEMNLARVEYYFSDLLSKLETRNGLDAENDILRRRAEIELEGNASGKDAMRRLFVSPYTLFVGTMNEDESTQMLSDKVIDRSNVLRFGRPRALSDGTNMQHPANKSQFIDAFAGSVRIGAQQWDEWWYGNSTDGNSAGMVFLRKTLAPVADALDKFGRPYAFRVDTAMRLYVNNYPGDCKHAVADQLEMKVLPKLNGADLADPRFAEVRKAMKSAIEATEDESLTEAFERSCNQSESFFKWRGVMR